MRRRIISPGPYFSYLRWYYDEQHTMQSTKDSLYSPKMSYRSSYKQVNYSKTTSTNVKRRITGGPDHPLVLLHLRWKYYDEQHTLHSRQSLLTQMSQEFTNRWILKNNFLTNLKRRITKTLITLWSLYTSDAYDEQHTLWSKMKTHKLGQL
jgi:hypothetical protein